MNVPNLRFSDDTWQLAKIGDVLTIERGGSPRPIQNFVTRRQDGINWIKIGDTSDDGYIYSAEEKIIPEGAKHSRKVKAGDLLLSNSMSFGKPYILKIDGCIHDGWLVIRDIDSKFNKEFLRNYLGSSFCICQYKKLAAGGVVTNLNKDLVCSAIIKYPPIASQEKIASFLCVLDERIRTQNKIIEKYESLMNSINNSFFKNIKTKIQFKDAYLRAGEGGTPDTKNSSYYINGNVPFIKIDDLNKKYIKNSKTFITESGLKHSSAWIVPPNSVLLSNGATIGETSINLIPVSTKQGILGIVPNAKYESEFLYYIFKSSYFKKELKRITTKGTMDAAYLKDINKMKIPYLEIEIQKHHNKIMNCFENKIDSEKKLLQLYSKTKIYLLNNLFI